MTSAIEIKLTWNKGFSLGLPSFKKGKKGQEIGYDHDHVFYRAQSFFVIFYCTSLYRSLRGFNMGTLSPQFGRFQKVLSSDSVCSKPENLAVMKGMNSKPEKLMVTQPII